LNRVRQLLRGTLPYTEFILSNKISKPLEDYKSKSVHVELAKRLTIKQPENAPQIGDRIQYLFTIQHQGAKAYEKACTVEEHLKHPDQYPIDYLYYYERRFQKQILTFLEPLCESKQEYNNLCIQFNPLWFQHNSLSRTILTSGSSTTTHVKKRNAPGLGFAKTVQPQSRIDKFCQKVVTDCKRQRSLSVEGESDSL
jgi:hypothetical protein